VPQIIHGAFGYAGQKCSAASRLIVLADIYEELTPRLISAAASLFLASAEDPGCRLGPVIDQSAYERLTGIVDNMSGAKILYRGRIDPGRSLLLPPVLLEVESPEHPLFQDELFGPILTLIKAPDFDSALALANNCRFALTGALFSRNREHIARSFQEFKVGNLYINRASTGAVVERQPFGGFKMSGTGNKAGGPGYLRLFADARCVTENTMRTGFSPDVYI